MGASWHVWRLVFVHDAPWFDRFSVLLLVLRVGGVSDRWRRSSRPRSCLRHGGAVPPRYPEPRAGSADPLGLGLGGGGRGGARRCRNGVRSWLGFRLIDILYVWHGYPYFGMYLRWSTVVSFSSFFSLVFTILPVLCILFLPCFATPIFGITRIFFITRMVANVIKLGECQAALVFCQTEIVGHQVFRLFHICQNNFIMKGRSGDAIRGSGFMATSENKH